MEKLRIHYLQHVAFEGLGYIEIWAKENGHELTTTKFNQTFQLPLTDEFEWLIILGGPMGVYDEKEYYWLKEEKNFIRSAIQANKTVIGICLGSQLLADVLGAKVYKNKTKEIGWFPVSLTEEAKNHPLLIGVENTFPVFHWHGDTFDLPEGAVQLFESAACKNQAFIFRENVLGLQFHLEVLPDSINEMVQHGKHELVSNEYIQTKENILSQTSLTTDTNKILAGILNKLSE